MGKHGHGHWLVPPGVRCHRCWEQAVTQAMTETLTRIDRKDTT